MAETYGDLRAPYHSLQHVPKTKGQHAETAKKMPGSIFCLGWTKGRCLPLGYAAVGVIGAEVSGCPGSLYHVANFGTRPGYVYNALERYSAKTLRRVLIKTVRRLRSKHIVSSWKHNGVTYTVIMNLIEIHLWYAKVSLVINYWRD